MSYTYEYPKADVTVDAVVFSVIEEQLKVLLIQRKNEPFAQKWALPGGYIEMKESLEDSVKRELFEETSLENIYMEQLYTFGDPGRDPRGRTISIAFFALVSSENLKIKGQDDALEAKWFEVSSLPLPLAFDHEKVILTAVKRLQGKITYQPIGFELLPQYFTLTEYQKLFEAVFLKKIDKRNFRKKILKTEILEKVSWKKKNERGPKGDCYKFNKGKYEQLEKEGFYLNFNFS